MRKIKFLFIFLLIILLVGCEKVSDYIPEGEGEKHYVTFMVDGNVVSRIEVSSNTEIEFPEDPIKDGYEFIGWYNLGVKWEENNSIENSIILTAKFIEGLKYLVEFYVDGNLYFNVNVNPNEYVYFPEEPHKENYKFVGWECNGVFLNNPIMVTNDVTVNAVFESLVDFDSWYSVNEMAYSQYINGSTAVSFYATKNKCEWDYIYKFLPTNIYGDYQVKLSFISPNGQWNIFKIESFDKYGNFYAIETTVYGTGSIYDLVWDIPSEYVTNMQEIRLLVFVNASIYGSGEITFIY